MIAEKSRSPFPVSSNCAYSSAVRAPIGTSALTDRAASRAYLDTYRQPETIAELRQHALIGYIPDFIYAEELRYLSEIDDSFVPVLSSSSINVQLAMNSLGSVYASCLILLRHLTTTWFQ